MNRDDIKELHFIAPIVNVPSILRHGILSYKRASEVPHDSLAMADVQEKRENKQIPDARTLHEYANLYFDAHNPMLSKRRSQNDNICVLRLDAAVLDLPGVILSDRNAAGRWVRFYPVSAGLAALDQKRIFDPWWKHPHDPQDERLHKLQKCAEVLVPDSVPPRFVLGAYVANDMALAQFRKLGITLPVVVRNGIFF